MATSIFLAKIIGIFSAVMALALLLNTKYTTKVFEDIIKQKGLTFLIGTIALTVGVFWIQSHNIWTGNIWVSIISLIGWLSFFKGIVLIVYPQEVMKLVSEYLQSKYWIYIESFFLVLFAVVFLYYGFI